MRRCRPRRGRRGERHQRKCGDRLQRHARRRARGLAVERGHLARHVGPVEGQHVLGGLGHQPVAQRLVGEQPLDHRRQVLGVAAVEAQAHAVVRGHDLAQAAGVGHDARAARGHRLQRHEPERLVQRGHHGEVGDPVERMQHVVADPAQEGAVGVEAELGGLAAQVLLGGARPGDQEAHVAEPLDQPRAAPRARAGSPSRRPAGPPAGPAARRARRSAARSASRSSTGTSSDGSIPLGITRDALLLEAVDVGHVLAHVGRAGDHAVGAVGHPALDAVDVGLRVLVHPALVAAVLGGVDGDHERAAEALGQVVAGDRPPASRARARGRSRSGRPPPRPRPACRRSCARSR